MHLQFYTDDTISGKGFHAQYQLVPNGAVANQNQLNLSPIVKLPNSPPSFYRSEQPAYRHRRQSATALPKAKAPFHGNRYVSRMHQASPWISQKSLYGTYHPQTITQSSQSRAWRVPYRPSQPSPRPVWTRTRIYNPHAGWSARNYRQMHPQLRPDVEYGVHEVGGVTSSYLPASSNLQNNHQGRRQKPFGSGASITSYRRISATQWGLGPSPSQHWCIPLHFFFNTPVNLLHPLQTARFFAHNLLESFVVVSHIVTLSTSSTRTMFCFFVMPAGAGITVIA